ncbi:MAG: hypothetical protein KAR32_08785 [Candidatus Omnitrophica bacterium]|nr:hypothetical protein [Candidatus Omnitrophota bacterium]
MTVATIDKKITKYSTDVERIEEHVKKWEEDFRLKTISSNMQKLLDTFNDLQMAISNISDSEIKQGFEINCYNVTYDFLRFTENDVDSDFYIYITNRVSEFSKVIKSFSQYCTKIEKKYDIELYSEKLFDVSPQNSRKKTAVKRK